MLSPGIMIEGVWYRRTGPRKFFAKYTHTASTIYYFFPAGKPMPVFRPRVLTAYHSVGAENRMRKVAEKNKERKTSPNEIRPGPLTNVAPSGYFFTF